MRHIARCLREEIQEACDHPRTNNLPIVCSLPSLAKEGSFYCGGVWLSSLNPPLGPAFSGNCLRQSCGFETAMAVS